jgi:NAD(P)-dependent dehydrogenase (short-subunit alcohol dehydrogenase family)
MTGKTVLITGGNAGIGLETGVGLARKGAHVVITSRDTTRGDAARAEIVRRSGNESVDVMQLDLASFASVRAFAAAFLERYERLDVLIDNAGLVLGSRSVTEDGNETTLQVNHLGHFLLTALLRDRLVASAPSRVVVLTSDAHKNARRGLDFDDLQSERKYRSFSVYSKTKLANVLFTRELARQLDGTGVTVNCAHPGFVASRFGRDGDIGPGRGDGDAVAPAVRADCRAGRADLRIPGVRPRGRRHHGRLLGEVRAGRAERRCPRRRRRPPAVGGERAPHRRLTSARPTRAGEPVHAVASWMNSTGTPSGSWM